MTTDGMKAIGAHFEGLLDGGLAGLPKDVKNGPPLTSEGPFGMGNPGQVERTGPDATKAIVPGGSTVVEMTRPKPGIYDEITDLTYHRLWTGACSSSFLKRMAESSPRHAQIERRMHRDTPSMRIGSALHCLLLRPHRFNELFAVTPLEINRRTKEGKAAYEQFLADAGDRQVLAPKELASAKLAAETAQRNKGVMQLLERCPRRELSVVAEYEGVLCKIRLDLAAMTLPVGGDLKSTGENATVSDFERAMANYDYDLQACLYMDVASVAGLELEHFAFAVVETAQIDDDGRPDRHTEAAVFRIDEESIAATRPWLRKLLAFYRQCEEAGVWPAYGEGITDVGQTEWRRKQLERVA